MNEKISTTIYQKTGFKEIQTWLSNLRAPCEVQQLQDDNFFCPMSSGDTIIV